MALCVQYIVHANFNSYFAKNICFKFQELFINKDKTLNHCSGFFFYQKWYLKIENLIITKLKGNVKYKMQFTLYFLVPTYSLYTGRDKAVLLHRHNR